MYSSELYFTDQRFIVYIRELTSGWYCSMTVLLVTVYSSLQAIFPVGAPDKPGILLYLILGSTELERCSSEGGEMWLDWFQNSMEKYIINEWFYPLNSLLSLSWDFLDRYIVIIPAENLRLTLSSHLKNMNI